MDANEAYTVLVQIQDALGPLAKLSEALAVARNTQQELTTLQSAKDILKAEVEELFAHKESLQTEFEETKAYLTRKEADQRAQIETDAAVLQEDLRRQTERLERELEQAKATHRTTLADMHNELTAARSAYTAEKAEIDAALATVREELRQTRQRLEGLGGL